MEEHQSSIFRLQGEEQTKAKLTSFKFGAKYSSKFSTVLRENYMYTLAAEISYLRKCDRGSRNTVTKLMRLGWRMMPR